MFRQLTQAMSGAATLSARVMAKAITVPVDTALWVHETTNRKLPQWQTTLCDHRRSWETELARLVADAADACLVVLEPHDHLHISHKRTYPRLVRVR